MSNITLTRGGLAHEIVGDQHTWPLKVTATSGLAGLPSEIFVYRRGQQGQAAYAGDVFENVASVHELGELGTVPSLLPNGQAVPFYRSDTLIFHCRSAEEAEDLWACVVEDAASLVRNFVALQNLVTAGTSVI